MLSTQCFVDVIQHSKSYYIVTAFTTLISAKCFCKQQKKNIEDNIFKCMVFSSTAHVSTI